MTLHSPLLARPTTSGCGGGQLRDKDDMSAHVIAVSTEGHKDHMSQVKIENRKSKIKNQKRKNSPT